jgi:TIR domain
VPDIFLSYRRQDSQSTTGRLADRLEDYFGPARVFHDHESIVAGEDFAEAIRRAISASTVVLAIIGPGWLAAALRPGTRRLDDPSDFVRLEIESALDAGIPVVPVLVEGASMPGSVALPASLAGFARCQAVELSESRWRFDTDRLIQALQSRFAIESDKPTLGDAPGQNTRLGFAARLAIDLLDLSTHPTRLIARRQTGSAFDHLRAFSFLLACLLMGNAALLIGLNLHPTGGVLGLVAWFVLGELFGLTLITLLMVPLTLAWRLIGTHVEYRQITLIMAYVFGGAWLGFCAGTMMVGTGMQFVDPSAFDRAIVLLQGTGTTALVAPPERVMQAQSVLSQALSGPASLMMVVAALVWLGTAGWAVVAWGAFRQAFGVGHAKATATTLLWLVMLVGLGWLVGRVGDML